MGTLLVVELHSKPGPGTLSSQIGRVEWSLLVAAKRLAATVKRPSHYSLPFTEPKHPLCSSSLPSAPPASSHSGAPDLCPTVSPKVSDWGAMPPLSHPISLAKNTRVARIHPNLPTATTLPNPHPHPCQKRTFKWYGPEVTTRLPSQHKGI